MEKVQEIFFLSLFLMLQVKEFTQQTHQFMREQAASEEFKVPNLNLNHRQDLLQTKIVLELMLDLTLELLTGYLRQIRANTSFHLEHTLLNKQTLKKLAKVNSRAPMQCSMQKQPISSRQPKEIQICTALSPMVLIKLSKFNSLFLPRDMTLK
jgi:hypothetical protein